MLTTAHKAVRITGWLSILLVGLFTSNLALGATVFSDVPTGHWAEPYINDLVAKGIVNGANPTYRGNDPVTRSEIAQLVAGAFGYLEGEKAVNLNDVGVSITPFKDVPKTAWYALPVYSLAKGGVLNGYTDQTGALTGSFGPGDNATRGQVLKIIKGAAGWATDTSCAQSFTDVTPSMWEYEFVETAYARKIVDGTMVNGQLMFMPGALTDRYQMAKIMSNSLNPGDRGCGEEAFEIVDITQVSNTNIEVCFNQPYNQTAAYNPLNYTITNSEGEDWEVLVDTDSPDSSTDPSCVTLATGELEYNEQYELKVMNVTSEKGLPLSDTTANFVANYSIEGSAFVCEAVNQLDVANVAPGTKNMEFLNVECKAVGFGPSVIDAVTFLHYGTGAVSDIEKVYLYANDEVLSATGQTINATTKQVAFDDLNYELPSGGELVTFTVKADISANAVKGAEHGFKVNSENDLQSDALDLSTYPLTGGLIKIGEEGAGDEEEGGGMDSSDPDVPDIFAGVPGEVTLARYEFTSELEDVSLRAVTFGVLDQSNGSTIESARLYTGSTCQTPVQALGGGSNVTEIPDTNGVLKFTNINLIIKEVGETSLCVKANIKSVTTAGAPDSGDTVGIVLLDVPEVIGGAGKNIAQKYMGTPVMDGGPVSIDSAMSATDEFVDMSGFSLSDSQVYLLDQEQIYAVDSNADILRGVGTSNVVSHAADTALYISSFQEPRADIAQDTGSITDTCVELNSVAEIEVGDLLIAAYFEYSEPEYLLVRKVGAGNIFTQGSCLDSGTDNIEVVRGMFGSAPQDWTNLTAAVRVGEYTERGPVSTLRASKPVFRTVPKSGETWVPVTGGVGTSEQAVLRFAIDAVGESGVDFSDFDGDNDYGTPDDVIQIRLTGNIDNSGDAHLSTCSLRNITANNETLDTVDLAGTSVAADGVDLNFDFFNNDLQISPGQTAILEVTCVMALASGESVSAMIDNEANLGAFNLDSTAFPTSVVIYNDGIDTTVDEDGEFIEGLEVLGPVFTGP